MPLPLLTVLVLGGLALGYALYGRLLARFYRLDPDAPTPAHTHRDGLDYEPAAPGYLLGQHFAAIAAAGPIVGPILACAQFGWLPCVLWVVFGSIFIGAVHDLSALVASVRHEAQTIAAVVREHLGRRAWGAFLAFIWLALVYVIVAFTDVTASTFVGRIDELDGVRVDFERGGAVAFASAAYLVLAVVMGLVQRRFSPPLWLVTVVFVPATLGVVWLGTKCSTWLAFAPGGAVHPKLAWGVVILAYCFVASLVPVWALMQPRGYLGGFVLYLVLATGAVGLLFGGFTVEQPAFRGLVQTGADGAPTPTGLLFPFLFVTIACGACSGFHGLVCSGTTSKQLDRETHGTAVGYGGMLLEAFVALVALGTVMIVAAPEGGPGAVYGRGIGEFLCVVVGREHLLVATVFGAMAFSTFVFDTLDVATRLGRHVLQELLGWRGRAGAAAGTLATIALPLAIVLGADPEAKGYVAFWTLFGASNQLLAALTLLGVSVWLARTGRPPWFTLVPGLFVLGMTLWALARLAWGGLAGARGPDGGLALATLMNGLAALALIGLALFLVVEAWRARPAGGAPPAGVSASA